ncbi:lipoprotein-releasing ABC transporter permease subunit [Thioalkalivibrio sp. XN279]|uniref:lipoprotein-releasing ABC transporter permease subunit n=1 Tax=Thioalkalivibrio sp. XN279 TaxID=2714953 RepID=UPI00140E8949|nr:lipoprotein-releasing ABC transporter permease subunit [Thioalkalivibrio sp. XN279]NHA15235.1 lipoprotein-releasing ABC transporter permease subunit [Thioalkalivibrio sp. XN279]
MSSRWRWLVGTRYLRARTHNRFVSFISAISILGVAVGVAVLIVVLSVMNGFESELRTRILSLAAHASLEGFGDGIADWRAVAAEVEAVPEVTASAPYVQGEGMLLQGEAVSGALVRGILPEQERRVSGLESLLVAGSLDALSAGRWNILLGSALARELGVGVGDQVVLAISQGMVTPAGVVPRLRRFTVGGVFEAGMYDFDRSLAFVHLDDAARLWRTGDKVTGLRVTLEDMFRAPELSREIAVALGGGFYVNDWTRQHVNFFRSIQLSKQMMFTILLLVVAVAAFNIVSTLVMVVKDKQGDIAILRTLGASPGGIMTVFIIQGTLIGAVGTLAGLGLGMLLALNVEQLVHVLEALVGTTFLAPDVYFMSDLPAELRVGDLWRICGTAFVLTVLSTIYPAWRAARSQPAEALRHE